MKEYKVIRIKHSPFKPGDIATKSTEILNQHARSGCLNN